ncbi:uncharacterized protein EDB91DRAFT_1246243 [Suillus paluster]|uniref:uncharacterized protein n=1 Tax=Suillus paluster TaxID=48578 RepID=UPI001B86728A|nr:uncharacterized protein EDB91DRAFT_1246243 [Suillus paluster]KAG1745380.1 hypothetical protein EDB91DRAFT_1246243 [Suillus paluster]
MRNISEDTSPTDAARTFYKLPGAASLYKGMSNKFYVIVVGHESGIFLKWEECHQAVAGFSSPCFKKLGSLPAALEFLITKAHRLGDAIDIASLCAPTLNLAGLSLASRSTSRTKSSMSSSISDATVHIDQPSTSAHVDISTTQNPSARAWRMPTGPSTSGTNSAPVYQHIHEINGVSGAVLQPHFDDTPLPSFGPMADWYLQAHGYTVKALLHVAYAHDMTSSAQDFVDQLADKGMARAEAFFLWGLITAQDSPPDV